MSYNGSSEYVEEDYGQYREEGYFEEGKPAPEFDEETSAAILIDPIKSLLLDLAPLLFFHFILPGIILDDIKYIFWAVKFLVFSVTCFISFRAPAGHFTTFPSLCWWNK